MKDDLPPALRGGTDVPNQQPNPHPAPNQHPVPQNNTAPSGFIKTASGIEYSISGQEIQFVEIALPSGQSIMGEGATMMFYDKGVDMKVRMGGGAQEYKGLFGKILGLGKAAISNEKIFIMTFTNTTQQIKKVAFAAPSPGKILAINLAEVGGSIFTHRDVFICSTLGVKQIKATQKDLGGGIMGTGLDMQKFEGNGMVFIHSGGSITERKLQEGEELFIASDAAVAYQATVHCRVKSIPKVGIMGDAYKLVQAVGPGKIWIQSLPFSKIQETVAAFTRDKFGLKINKKAGVMGGWGGNNQGKK